MKNVLFTSAIVSLALVGCSNQLNEEDSVVAFSAASTVVAQGASQAQSGTPAAVQAEDSPAFRDAAAGAVDYSFSCPSGGTAHFTGAFDAVADGSGGQATFSLSTDFAACKSLQNVTIDGNMDYAASIVGSDAGGSVTFSMNGSLDFSGQVDGSCDIDVKFSASGSAGGSAGVTYSGSICGHDAAATLNVQG